MAEHGRRRRPADERTEQLLDAAEQVLVSRGLAATTIADVAEAAGVAKGTVYLYFNSKDELLAGLRARYVARFTNAVDVALAGRRASPATRLDRFVDGLFEFSDQHRALHHVLFHQAGFSEADAFTGMRGVLERIVADGSAGGTFDVRDTGAAVSYVVHGLHGLLVDALGAPAPELSDHQAAARDLARRSLSQHPARKRQTDR